MRARDPYRRLLAATFVLALPACSQPLAGTIVAGTSGVVPASARRAHSTSNSPIQHLVIIVQENRSFENLFAGFPGADAPMYGPLHTGQIVPLRPVNFVSEVDLNHTIVAAYQDYDLGRMNQFDLPYLQTLGHDTGTYAYSYVQRNLIAPYWTMASRYTLADHMFATEFGGSFTAHLDLIAGTTLLTPTLAEADIPSAQPWSCDAPPNTVTSTWNSQQVFGNGNGPFPCFTQFETMANTLDAAGVSWKYYAPPTSDNGYQIWTTFAAIKAVRYGPDWSNIITPETTVLTDAANGALPAVSWVIPDQANSDHPGNGSGTGPSWVAQVVNGIGQSPEWNSTAIVLLWDDWGGWYDNLPPPQLSFYGLGFRVPCVIISPYAKAHYVSHTQYEFGSILKFAEQTFGLASLDATDARAASLADSFDFSRPPKAFIPISAPYPASHFLREKPSFKAPDDY
jgi:phospholipase C